MLSTAILTTALAAALPAAVSAGFADAYTNYTGDGSVAAGWPSRGAWATYEQLWQANAPLMLNSCSCHRWGADTSATELQAVRDAIDAVSVDAGLDRRFILAIVVQESKGCVRAPTTENGVVNPGLMQSHNGSGTCAEPAVRLDEVCSAETIEQMIREGTQGTEDGDGLVQTLAEAGATAGNGTAQAFYVAARLYNSGSADLARLEDGITATACYASDVANRLTGWTLATSKCRQVPVAEECGLGGNRTVV